MRYVEEALEETKYLKEWDEDGDTWVKIKQALGREEARRDQLFARTMVERDTAEGTVREIYDWPGGELTILECYLTFVDAYVPRRIRKRNSKGEPVLDDKGQPVYEINNPFQPGMSEAAFRSAFLTQPRQLIMEWRNLVHEVNPHWAPGGMLEIEKN